MCVIRRGAERDACSKASLCRVVKLRGSRKPTLPLPRLAIHRRPESIFDYRFDDFEILGYQHHPHIKAAVAV